VKTKDDIPSVPTIHLPHDDFAEEHASDEGWQEAVPKGRSTGHRKAGPGTRRPNLAKINTNASENGRYKGRTPSNFTSPRVSPNVTVATVPSSPVSNKLVKSSSFNSKAVSPAVSSNSGEISSNPNSKPASAATTTAVAKVIQSTAPIASQTVRKSLSYKEVAIAAPGTLVKALDDVHAEEKVANLESVKPTKENIAHPSEEKDKDTEVSPPDNTSQVSKATDVGKTNVPVGSNQPESETSGPATTSIVKNSSNLVGTYVSSESSKQTEANNSNEETPVVTEENDSSSNDDERDAGGDTPEQLSSGGENEVSSPSESEKNDTPVEGAKEITSKLSAAAAPFNPSTVPAYGSMAVPGFREHGGLLPSPANVPPMLSIPFRKHPHQSASARIPYGPRLAGGYNRSGHRGTCNKTALPNGEGVTDTNTSAIRVMNPNAPEFMPGQSRSHPASPNGPLTSPGGSASSPHGAPSSPDGSLESPIIASPQVSECSQTSPEGNDAPNGINDESVGEKENTDAKSIENKDGELELEQTTASEVVEEADATRDVTDASNTSEQPKSWADYSDGEVEAVVVAG
jgi:protein TIF31